MTGGIDMQKRNRKQYFGLALMMGLLASSSVVAANNCTTGAKAAAQIWNKYDKIIKPLGCAAGAAGAAALSGGVALPASASTFASCLNTANTADKATKGMIEAWNDLNKNGWGTIGDRDLRMGGSYEGAVPSVATRMWIMSAPVTDPFVRLRIAKRQGGWNNAAATRVTVCSFPPAGPGVDVSGEEIWSYEFDSGKENQGKAIDRVFAVPGTVLTVAFKGKSVGKNFKYRLELEKVGGVDHDVVIAGEPRSGTTNYELEASGGLEQVHGNFLNGYKATVDDNDQVRSPKAWGSVGSGNDAYVIAGEIKKLELEDGSAARVFVDGKRRGKRDADHTIVIDGSSADGGSDYVIRGGGTLQQVSGKLDGHDMTIQSDDKVTGDRAMGNVGAGKDGYEVTGKIPTISLEQPANAAVYVNGRPYHSVVIDGTAGSGDSSYSLHVDGSLSQVSGRFAGHDVTIQSDDQVNGDRAEGEVGAGKDAYAVLGGWPRITLDDPSAATIEVDGRVYHTVVIDGSASSGGTGYTLEGGDQVIQVEGSLAGHEVTIQSDDRVSGNRAEGHVGAGKDGFIVLGGRPNVTLSTPANAAIYIDGQRQAVQLEKLDSTTIEVPLDSM